VQAGTQHNETNKMFLKFTNLLSEQYKAISAFYDNISLGDIISITSGIISELISLSPDSFSLELTNEESIFYTFKKGDYSFYIQQYFETEEDGFNATLVCYKGDNKMDSLNGNIRNLLFSMEQKIYNTIPHNLNLTLLNEISY
jgi:preprotein translocase subunit YajC